MNRPHTGQTAALMDTRRSVVIEPEIVEAVDEVMHELNETNEVPVTDTSALEAAAEDPDPGIYLSY